MTYNSTKPARAALRRTLALAAVAAAALVACGSGSAATARPAGLPGGYHAITVVFDQRPLHCLLADGDGYGMSSGLSCDWVGYHQAH